MVDQHCAPRSRALSSVGVPVAPLEEQRRIADEARRRVDAAGAQADAIRASLARLPEMERELLAAAVAGELISQEPSEERATALLERLGPPPRETPPGLPAEDEDGATVVITQRKAPSRRSGPTADLATVLRDAGRPLPLPELFGQAGYDRDQPEHVELFYLALRSQLGRTIRQTGQALENAVLEAVDAA